MSFWSEWSDGKKWLMGILSALIITALVGLGKFLFSREDGLPEQRVPFSASSDAAFAIQSTFEGTAVVSGHEVVVDVAKGYLSYPKSIGAPEARHIDDIRVSLAEASEGSWRTLRRSERHEIDQNIALGEVIPLLPFRVTIDTHGLESLAGHWIVFDIAEQVPENPETIGLSHSHTRNDLF